MKKILTTQKVLISVKDAENDTLTEREEYCYNELITTPVFQNQIFGEDAKKIANYICVHYGYDNYSVITNNPVIIALMIEAGKISIDMNVFENMASIPQSAIDNYKQLVS